MKWFLRIVVTFNIIISLLTICGYLASYISPSTLSFPQGVGLFMPWLLFGNVIFGLFWMTMRKKWAWLSVCTLLVGWSHISRFVGFHVGGKTAQSQIVLCTFNAQSYSKNQHIVKFFENLENKEEIDLLCLQEISDSHIPLLKELADLPHSYFHKGKIILTRFPIKNKGHFQVDDSVNGCLWIDIQTNQGLVRIYNVHLKSNGVSPQARTIMGEIQEGSKTIAKMGLMIGRYQEASIKRIDQVREIISHINQTSYPVLLAGDFNDTPFSYIYHQFDRVLIDHFKVQGFGIGSTYAGSLPGLKIDYIFADEKIDVLTHTILKTRISDHFPVLSHVILK